ncbi:neuropeptide Y receptor type 1 [Danio rerio]|uniref:Neuropeptide Y receptor type 1 n=1 Tax=Danio rerio TaxID=7955 RepID=A7UD89_DANRE|nr:neuropeptide Y receptor type 1 [Danio rerio]ABS89150.1 Npy1r protein [Danio rerio]|eukprot:NP_001095861.1 neuropeptide Y receptor type 1 [Danio rerio]
MPDSAFSPPVPPIAALNCSLDLSNCSITNLSAIAYGDECYGSHSLFVIMAVAYSAVVLLGVIGNLALILVIARQRELHNVTNVLIANLSVSDLLMAVVCLPFTFIYTFMDHWVFGAVMCKLNSLVQCCSVSVSIFSLVLIAIERHQLILHPRGWRPSLNHACLGISLTWALAVLTATPFLLFSRVTDAPLKQLPSVFQEQYRGKVVCVEEWPSREIKLTYTTGMLVLQYITPLTFIFICYLKIYTRLQRRNNMMERIRENKYRSSESKRINIMLFSIVVAFAVCWLPLNVFNAVIDWNHEVAMNCTHNLLFSLCHLTAMCSVCINPVFYGFLNRNFQRDLRAFRLCKIVSTRENEYDMVAMSTVNTDVSKMSLKMSSLDL